MYEKKEGEGEKTWRTRYRSEFSMGILDFERFHELLKNLDTAAVLVMRYDINSIILYCSLLKELWFNWRPLISSQKDQEFKKSFDSIDKEILDKIINNKQRKREWPFKTVEKLVQNHKDLLYIKQVSGLGINVVKDRTEKEKQKWLEG